MTARIFEPHQPSDSRREQHNEDYRQWPRNTSTRDLRPRSPHSTLPGEGPRQESRRCQSSPRPFPPSRSCLRPSPRTSRPARSLDRERLLGHKSLIPQRLANIRRPFPLFSASEPSGLDIRRPKSHDLACQRPEQNPVRPDAVVSVGISTEQRRE